MKNLLRKCLILFFLFPFLAYSQIKSIGTPIIRNYLKSDYSAGTQNWGITQDKDGVMYFANNDGLLSFDGIKWDLLEVSSSAPLRSVLVDSKNSIYVGLINDFGIIKQEEPNAPVFVSFKDLLPEDIPDFDDIWRIHETKKGIIFQCYDYLFVYKDGKVTVLEPQSTFYNSFQIVDRFFIQEPELGIFELVDGVTVKNSYWEAHKEKNVRILLETSEDQILVGTETDGLFIFENEKLRRWNAPVNDFLITNRLYCGTVLPGNYYAFGTILNGLVIADKDGNIIKKMNTENGLHNNTILSVLSDKDENLWLGLDNGIDFIELSSPLSFVGSDDIGSGYCSKVFNGNLYMGTNQGLYVRPYNNLSDDSEIELVKNTAGQVWSLDIFDGQLICGHNLGTFRISGNEATQISEEEGAWKYIRLKDHNDFLLGGHYFGLVLLKKENNKWKFYKKLKGFDESSRYLYQDDNGDIWVGHSGKGIYRITLSNDLEEITEVSHYTDKNGLPSTTGNILFAFQSKLYVSNNEGIYTYNEDTNVFVLDEKMMDIFGVSGKIKTAVPDENGDVWYIASEESGVIRQNEDMSFTRITAPFKRLNDAFVNEFEFIYPYDSENIFLGVEEGFIHYSTEIAKSYNQPFNAYVSVIEASYLDSMIYLHDEAQKKDYAFPFRKNAFRFHFSAPYFETEIPVEFSYFLEGFSEEWSSWSTDAYKDFTMLHEGVYILKLKAKNTFGIESEPYLFTFEILPPWHRSAMAYAIYLFAFILFAFAGTRYILYRLEQSKQREKIRHQQEIREQEEQFQREALIAEKEIIKLRNDKLRSEMVHRDKELANQTMGIIRKNKFLIKVNEDLNSIQDFIINETAKSKILNLKKRIKKEIDIKQQSKIFETYFDEVHEEFFKKLKEQYPVLTPNDLRICAFIRMNLTTQEIAAILNISYRGAEISRYRLRKKLGLDRSTNLSTFLTNI